MIAHRSSPGSERADAELSLLKWCPLRIGPAMLATMTLVRVPRTFEQIVVRGPWWKLECLL